jgi:type VI secretion system secreted protein Hcp
MKKKSIIVVAIVIFSVAIVGEAFYSSILNQASGAPINTVQAFLTINGIPGDSTDPNHNSAIALESFNWTELQAMAARSAGGGGTQQRVSVSDFTFTALCSSASPKLFLDCATGVSISKAVLSVERTSDGKSTDFMVWTLSSVIISSYTVSFNTSNGAPMDQFSINFAKAQVTFLPLNANGSYGSPVQAGFDISANKAV